MGSKRKDLPFVPNESDAVYTQMQFSYFSKEMTIVKITEKNVTFFFGTENNAMYRLKKKGAPNSV